MSTQTAPPDTAQHLVERLKALGLTAVAIEELSAVFHLIGWLVRSNENDHSGEGLDDHGLAVALLSRVQLRNLTSFGPSDIDSALAALAADLEGSSTPHEPSLSTCFDVLAQSVRHVRADESHGLRVAASWFLEPSRQGRFERCDSLETFDQIIHATKTSGHAPAVIPDGLGMLLSELSGPRREGQEPDPALGSPYFLSVAAKQVLTEIPHRGDPGPRPDSQAHWFVLGLVRELLSGANDCQNLDADTPDPEAISTKADFVLTNPPFGIKVTRELQSQRSSPVPIKDPEGLFLQHILDQLPPGGRAAVIVPRGFLLRRGKTQELRRRLVEGGHLNTVVRLPAGAFPDLPGLATAMLMLCKDAGATTIRMIDANALGQVCEAWDVPANELANNHWNLASLRSGPLRQHWLNSRLGQSLTEHGQIVALGSCAKLRVGHYVPAKYLTGEPSVQGAPAYLRIADLQNGAARNASSWISPARRIDAGHLLQVGDVLLSRSGTVDKAGVVHDTALPAIAGGGIFVLHIDQSRLDPHFLVAYFASAESRAWLKGNSPRTVINNLTLPLMNGMNVPLPPLSLQRKAATRFQKDGTDVLAFLKDELGLRDSDPQMELT